MKDLIRSPLQFVRQMTQSEWQDLMYRETYRETMRNKRRSAPKAAPAKTKSVLRSAARRSNQVAGSPGWF